METHFEKIKHTQFWSLIHKNNPDEIIKYTMKSEFIDGDEKIFNSMLDFLSKNYNIPEEYLSPKIFTSMLVIAKFPDVFLDSNRELIEKSLYDRSCEIYNFINENQSDYKLLGKKLFSFKIVFEDWKEKDLKQQVYLLCEMYYRYCDTIEEYKDDPSKKEYIDELLIMNNKILNNMKRLTPNYQSYLDNYENKHVSYSDKVNSLVYNKLKDLYWDNINTEIFEHSNYKVIDTIIDDYQDVLSQLNNETFNGNKFNDYRGIHTKENFKNIAVMMVRYNKQLDSENYDEIYDYTIEKINENIHNAISIIKICFDRLEMIIKIKETVNEQNSN
jgi:hypothetical protein